MIKTYDRYDEGRTKIFFSIDDDGKFGRITVGNQAVNNTKGFQFYVDDYVAEQIYKCEIVKGDLPGLRVKEGETLFVPKENDEYLKEKRMKELEEELRRLKEES